MTVVATLAIAFLLTVALVPAVRALARRSDIVARPAPDRWHGGVVPKLGGVAMAMASLPLAWWVTEDANVRALVVFAGVMSAVGLVDDLRQTRPLVKLAGQAIAVAVFFLIASPLPLTGVPATDAVMGAAWLLVAVNAFNLLDNIDGLAASVAAIAALGAVVSVGGRGGSGSADVGLLLAAIGGTALGFLIFNWRPASIFMGDAGSHLLGACLGGATLIAVSGTPVPRAGAGVAALVLLLVPIADAAMVTVTRLIAGRHPFAGGRDHASHRLVARGLSERGAVITLAMVAIAGGLVAWSVVAAPAAGNVAAAAYVLGIAVGAVWISAGRGPTAQRTSEPSP